MMRNRSTAPFTWRRVSEPARITTTVWDELATGFPAGLLLLDQRGVVLAANAMVTELERFELSEPAPSVDQPGEELPMNSALLLGPFEIPQLDNDPSFPENGVLLLDVRGGR